MKSIRLTIRKLINEMFDNIKLPDDLIINASENKVLYSFKTNTNSYCVRFEVLGNKFEPVGLTNSKKINHIIVNNKSFYLNWGVCDIKNNPIDNEITNSKEEIYVLNSVFAIINKFFKENNPDIVFYQAIEKRKMIYDKMFDKINMSNYYKTSGFMNTFLIKKELI